ncbi:uncharacterized protein LOC142227589 [Haematobia irritans]|uniref:uncharacterized protein LOC142227589 n=1 Tax=Haematobia irritans TaxID=7368 RepID=UPI003F4F4221
MPDGKCVLAKNYVDHCHDHQENEFKEISVLNKIKSDCIEVASTLCGTGNAVSSIKQAFEKTVREVDKYECWVKSCKARVNLMPDGKCVLAKNYVDHCHDHQENEFKEISVLNKIKSDCIEVASTLCGTGNAVSSIKQAFEKTVRGKNLLIELEFLFRFHFCQAVRRYVSKNRPLFQYLKNSKAAMDEYKKIMALPLLPPTLIVGTFNDIKLKILLMDGEQKFSSFLAYFERHWLKKVGHHNISVYKKDIRTTSAVEAYNGVMGKLIEKNGNFFKFVEAIRKEEYFKSRSFQMLCDIGVPVKKKKKRSSKEAIITDCTHLLDNAKITAMKFIERIVFDKSISDSLRETTPYENTNVVNTDSETDHSEDEIADEEQIVSNESNRSCVVCRGNSPNIVFLPCKHLSVCHECNLKLQANAIERHEEDYKCPCCRHVVQDVMQVFV